jgi:hypothetical protein
VALGEPRSLNAPLKKFHHGLQEAAKYTVTRKTRKLRGPRTSKSVLSIFKAFILIIYRTQLHA